MGNYKEIKEKERRAKLLLHIAQKAPQLRKEQLETAVNNFPEELLEELSEEITIFVCQSPESFGDDATLESNFFEHSWAGGEGEKEYGMELYPVRSDWTLGYFSYKRYVPDDKEVPQFKFGVDYRMDYSDNGKPCVPNVEKRVPDFDTEQVYVVLKDCMSYNYYNGNEFEEHKYELVIYVPNGTYDFEPEVKYILDNFFQH